MKGAMQSIVLLIHIGYHKNQCEYLCYSPETISTLLIGYTLVENKN